MDEMKLIDAINDTRIRTMKIKYYAFVQAYKKAYSQNPSAADVENFLKAAVALAQQDVCDIIFPYSLVEENKDKRFKEALQEEDNPYYYDLDLEQYSRSIE